MTNTHCEQPVWRHFIQHFSAFALMALLVCLPLSAQASSKYSSIVIDAKTGEIVRERDGDAPRYPASLTKMMTLYVTFEALAEGRITLDKRLVTSRRAAGQPASKLYLKAGQTITVEQAILALVTQSANDAATVLAEGIGGTEVKFAAMMTERARSLGMMNTTFKNASGLPNRQQKTTARDMALLARALIEHYPDRYHYFSTRAFKFGNRTHANHNRLLGTYAGTDGIKTGYIDASGYNLVSSVKRGPHHLIGVVFGGRTGASRNAHMKAILTESFDKARTGNFESTDRVAFTPVPTPRGGVRMASAWEYEKARGTAIAAGQWFGQGQSRAVMASAAASNVAVPNARPVFAGGATQGSAGSSTIAAAIIASPALAAVPQSRPVSSREIGDWQIQVGAYYSQQQAHARAAKARSSLSFLAEGEVVTPPLKRGNRTIYRARIAGFSQPEAATACRSLTRKGFDCLAIAPSKSSSVASAR